MVSIIITTKMPSYLWCLRGRLEYHRIRSTVTILSFNACHKMWHWSIWIHPEYFTINRTSLMWRCGFAMESSLVGFICGSDGSGRKSLWRISWMVCQSNQSFTVLEIVLYDALGLATVHSRWVYRSSDESSTMDSASLGHWTSQGTTARLCLAITTGS